MKYLIAALLFIPLVSHSECIPRNNAYIPDDIHAMGINHTQFTQTLKRVETAYAKVVGQYGARLVFDDNWSDGTVNAFAYRQGNDWHVAAFGGLARFKGMTISGYLTVLCHEVGHHLGGSPRYDNDTDWAAVEGQADYWAETCMKAVSPSTAMKGAMSISGVLASLGGEPMPRVNTPDPTVVAATMEGHPPAQCRLDTYVRGIQSSDRPRCWFKP